MATSPPGVNYAGTGGQNVDVVVAAFDNGSGVPQIVSVANPFPVTSAGGASANRSFVYLPYKATATATGYNTGDLIQQIEEYNTATTPSTYVDTIWRNVTQETTLAGAPLAANIVPVSATASAVSITNAPNVKLQDGLGNVINSLFNASGDQELLTATGATNFTVSTNNSTVVQLAASATFTGVIENAFNAPSVSVLLACDQPGILTFNQYITTSAGTICNSVSYPTPATTAGNCFTQSWVVNGNDVNFTFKNTGASTTTTLNLNVAYGNILPATSLLNLPVAIREINGKALNIGQQASANSLPVVLSTDGPGSSASSPVYVSGSGSSPVITGFTAMTVGTTYSSGIALQIICTIAGSVNIQLLNGTTFSLAVSPGYYLLPYAVTQIVTSGTTATATYGNMASTASSTSSSFSSSVPMTLGTVYSAASALQVQCTIAGNVTITLANATTMVIPVPVGYSLFPFSVTEVATASGPATATYTNLS